MDVEKKIWQTISFELNNNKVFFCCVCTRSFGIFDGAVADN